MPRDLQRYKMADVERNLRSADRIIHAMYKPKGTISARGLNDVADRLRHIVEELRLLASSPFLRFEPEEKLKDEAIAETAP